MCKPARTVPSQRVSGDTPCEEDAYERQMNAYRVQISWREGSVLHCVTQRLMGDSWSQGDLDEACGLQRVIFRGKGSVLWTNGLSVWGQVDLKMLTVAQPKLGRGALYFPQSSSQMLKSTWESWRWRNGGIKLFAIFLCLPGRTPTPDTDVTSLVLKVQCVIFYLAWLMIFILVKA